MKRFIIKKVLKVVLFVLIAISIMTAVVMLLWNWLMPEIFGLPSISFWQAGGLWVLSKLLFSGFGRPSSEHKKRWRQRLKQRFSDLPEEKKAMLKEKFRQKFNCQD